MSAFFQDENGNWWYFFWGDVVICIQVEESVVESLDSINDFLKNKDHPYYAMLDNDEHNRCKKLLQEGNEYRDSVYIKGDFTSSFDMAWNLAKEFAVASLDDSQLTRKLIPNKKYDTILNNCVQKTMEVFSEGQLSSGFSVKEYLHANYYKKPIIPNLAMNYLQDIFYNNATTLEGYNSGIKAAIERYNGKGIIGKFFSTRDMNNFKYLQ